jgi:hypothetical protein
MFSGVVVFSVGGSLYSPVLSEQEAKRVKVKTETSKSEINFFIKSSPNY